MKSFKEKLVVIFVFAVILLIGLKYCNDKNGYHLDEVYTYVLSNSEYAPWIVDIKGGNVINTVISRQELKDALTVNENDRFSFGSVYYNQTQDVHPPLYYFFVHTISSIFTGTFSKWIGLGLNYFLFVATLFLLYEVVSKYFGGHRNANFIVLVYGLSNIALSTLMFIRMYMLLTFFTLLLAYYILKIIENDKKCYVAIAITIFLGMITQYYFVIYAFFVCLSCVIYLLIKKRYKQVISFSVSALLGVAFMVAFFPHFVTQLSLQESVSMDRTVQNVYNVQKWWTRFLTMGQDVGPDMIVAIMFMVVLSAIYLVKVKQHRIDQESLKKLVIIIPAYISYIVVCIIAPYVTDRYVYHLIPVMILFLGFLTYNSDERLKRKGLYYIGLFAVTIISIYGLRKNEPNYVYDHSVYNMIIEDNAKYPCVFVSENEHAPITSAIPQLLYFDECMVVNEKELENITDYINKGNENKGVALFVSSLPTNIDRDLVFEKMHELGYQYNDQIYEDRFFSMYLFYL